MPLCLTSRKIKADGKTKQRPKRPLLKIRFEKLLLNFPLFKQDMFPGNRIVFLYLKLVRHGTGVLFDDVKEARVCRTIQANLNATTFGHSNHSI
jgi:hypothetical protein